MRTLNQLRHRWIQKTPVERNLPKVLGLSFAQVFLVVMPIAVPFFMSRGLDMQGVFALQALFAVCVVVLEVPSGYVADIFGRRNTLVLGSIFGAVGHSVLVMTDGPMGLVLWEICLAFAHSLVSGSDLAMAYDSEQASRPSVRNHRRGGSVVGQLYSVRSAGDALAAVLCSLILLFADIDVILWVQAVVGWLPAFIALSLVEPPGQRLSRDSHRANMARILRHLWHRGSVLRYTFVGLSIWTLTTMYAVWLLQKLWEEQGIPLMAFGYLWASLSILSGIVGQYATRIESALGVRKTLCLLGALPVLGYLLVDLGGIAIGLLGALMFYLARGIGIVVLREALNSRVPGEFRATANSLSSFVFRGAFALTGPIVGFVFDWWGMATTFAMLAVVSAALFAVTLLPLLLALGRGDDVNARAAGVPPVVHSPLK